VPWYEINLASNPIIWLIIPLDFIYMRTTPDGLEDEALIDTLKLAHFWDLQDLFQKSQQLLVAALDVHNWEFCKSA
jgi:hypothetical protein